MKPVRKIFSIVLVALLAATIYGLVRTGSQAGGPSGNGTAAEATPGQAAGVDQTPTLSVNGRMLPLGGNLPYEQIKQLIQYQATLDGVDSGATAETLAPKPPKPTLQDLPK